MYVVLSLIFYRTNENDETDIDGLRYRFTHRRLSLVRILQSGPQRGTNRTGVLGRLFSRHFGKRSRVKRSMDKKNLD